MTPDREGGSGATAAVGETGDPPGCGAMRTWRWCLPATFRDPGDTDVPELPEWTVHRDGDDSLAFGEGGERPLHRSTTGVYR